MNKKVEIPLEKRINIFLNKFSSKKENILKILVRLDNLYLNKKCCSELYDSLLECMNKKRMITKEPLNSYGIFTLTDIMLNPSNSKGQKFYFLSKKEAEKYNFLKYKKIHTIHYIKKIKKNMIGENKQPYLFKPGYS